MRFPWPPAGKSANEPQKEKTADQYNDGNPKMNVGEHGLYPAARLIRSAVLIHQDSFEAPESPGPGGFAADDTIGKGGILLREINYLLR
jgi:hypothetical protein